MSIYKHLLIIPSTITSKITNTELILSNQNGSICQHIPTQIELIKKDQNELEIISQNKAFFYLILKLIKNNIYGLLNFYTKTLIAEGIGYKFILDQNKLNLHLGYANVISLLIPTNILITPQNATQITLKSINKQNLGLFCAKIKQYKKINVYTGKGIKDEMFTKTLPKLIKKLKK